MRSGWLRQYWAALRLLLVLTVVLGLGYPVAAWGAGQLLFTHRADGSAVTAHGTVVGSTLIGQRFTGARWFHPRPSAGDYSAGGDGNGGSGASNLGPQNRDLVSAIRTRRAQVARENGVPESAVPPDAVTASASGLDPGISPAYAGIQVDRVARARGLSVAQVRGLVDRYTVGRTLGFLGQPYVNVLQLNLAVDRATPGGH